MTFCRIVRLNKTQDCWMEILSVTDHQIVNGLPVESSALFQIRCAIIPSWLTLLTNSVFHYGEMNNFTKCKWR
jgi:hypothetical protein